MIIRKKALYHEDLTLPVSLEKALDERLTPDAYSFGDREHDPLYAEVELLRKIVVKLAVLAFAPESRRLTHTDQIRELLGSVYEIQD